MSHFENTTYPNRDPATIPPSTPPTHTERVTVTHDGAVGGIDVDFFEVPETTTGHGAGAVTTISEHTRVEAAFPAVVDPRKVVQAAEIRVIPSIGEDETRRQQAIDALLGVLGLTRTVEGQ